MKELTKGSILLILLIMNACFVSDPAEKFATSASIETTFTKNNAYLGQSAS